MEELALRPTEINETRYKHDYCVVWKSEIYGERHAGRIRLATEREWAGEVWEFSLQPIIAVPAYGNGSAPTLKEAQQKFRAAFERFCRDDAGDLGKAFPRRV
jgi:hypothetical protein